GVRVFAVASGPDGVRLVKRLGADGAIDGRRENIHESARAFAPDGFDAALVLAGGAEVDRALKSVRKGGCIAHPNGVEPAPTGPKGVKVKAYDGVPRPDTFERLNRLIGRQPFHVEISKTYKLSQAPMAHRDVERHHLGKLALQIH